VLAADEVERALAGIATATPTGLRDRTMLELLYSTGVRRGELAGLDVGDVDFARCVLRVRRGKGGRSRVVPLGRRAATWLHRYLDDGRPRALRRADEPALFLSRRGVRIGVKMVTARMHACLRRAGLTKGGSCHIVRHSVATLMHEAGADIRDLQVLLGHALLTSTQLYTRVSLQHLQAVHRRTHPTEIRQDGLAVNDWCGLR
jgi:integrase/recombinase XerD